jgi:hypothetical protein
MAATCGSADPQVYCHIDRERPRLSVVTSSIGHVAGTRTALEADAERTRFCRNSTATSHPCLAAQAKLSGRLGAWPPGGGLLLNGM